VNLVTVLFTSATVKAQRERPDRPDHGAAGTKGFERPEGSVGERLDTPERISRFFNKQTGKFQSTPKEPQSAEFRNNFAFLRSGPSQTEDISIPKENYRSYLERIGQSGQRVRPLSFAKYLAIYFVASNPKVSSQISFQELVDEESKGKKLSDALKSRGIDLRDLVVRAERLTKQYQR